MRKTLIKITNIIICLGFALFLAWMAAGYLFGTRNSYSEKEKRYLAPAPKFKLSSVLSGEFAEDAESYAADHMPMRDFFVGLNAYAEKLIGMQTGKEIIEGESGRLYERPDTWNGDNVSKNVEALNAFASFLDKDVDLMLVPSAGYIMRDDMPRFCDTYRDKEYIDRIYSMTGDRVNCIDLTGTFENSSDRDSLYYRTDHHWTSYGAYTAASVYGDVSAKDVYDIERVPGFFGTTYSRSALWNTPSETVELWRCGRKFTVENEDSEGMNEGLFYTGRLSETDKYPVFLDGNHSLVRIHNAEAEGRLLVIRDSFGNCLGGFLAENYEETVLVDLRYYREDVARLARDGNFDRILVVYDAGNFMDDLNFAKIEPDPDDWDEAEEPAAGEPAAADKPDAVPLENSETFITEYETVNYETGETVKKKMAVYLPAGYREDGQYNAVFLMHVSGCNETFWLDLGIQGLMDRLIAEGQIEPTVVFMPDGYINDEKRGHQGDDTIYVQMSGELRDDLVPFVREYYALYGDRDHMAFMGASFGAYMTVNSALCPNLDLFSNFGYVGGGTIDLGKLENSWSAYGTQDLDIHMMYIGEGDRDDRGPVELSYMTLMGGCDKFSEHNLVFSLMEGYAHEPAEWVLGVQEALPLFWPASGN